MPKAQKGRGHPDVFTSAQNRALREGLHALKEKLGDESSQKALGEAMGVSQQTAGKLLDGGGFSYAPATALVRKLGFTGVDSFFTRKGVALSEAG